LISGNFSIWSCRKKGGGQSTVYNMNSSVLSLGPVKTVSATCTWFNKVANCCARLLLWSLTYCEQRPGMKRNRSTRNTQNMYWGDAYFKSLWGLSTILFFLCLSRQMLV
jgi:hypothetical protein